MRRGQAMYSTRLGSGMYSVLRRRGVAPLGLGTLVAADVYEFRGEEIKHLIEDVFEEPEDVVRDPKHVIGDSPRREDLNRLAGVPELGIGRDRGHRMARHLDLWDHRDASIGGVPHDLAHVVLRVEAAVRPA